MIEPDLKTQLDQINQNLTEINKKTKFVGLWRSFFNGMVNALGYVVGLAIVLVIFGWVLQRVGLWQAFTQQMQNVQDVISEAKNLMPANTGSKNNIKQSGGLTTVTLPNGQQIQVNLPSGN